MMKYSTFLNMDPSLSTCTSTLHPPDVIRVIRKMKNRKKNGGWGAGNKASIQIQENLFILYSRLILQGANFRVFRESGLIHEIFFPAKILESNT